MPALTKGGPERAAFWFWMAAGFIHVVAALSGTILIQSEPKL